MPASDRSRRRLIYPLTAALVAAVAFFAVAPPRAARTTARATRDPWLPGAYHIHTTRSDGALDRDAVARAASLAGLKFAIFTDHGDATQPPPSPAYLHGVLCVDGVEISTNDGHYVALGIGQAPYPLGGDGDAVAEDVARLGGLGIAAHPFSQRRELAWTGWDAPLDGIEWLNADSEWRDERRLSIVRAFLGYLIRPAAALASIIDRPLSTLAKWDELAKTRRVIALPAHDAHGGLGQENGGTPGRRLHLPSYEATFRTFSLRVKPASALTGDASRDAVLLLAAIREGSAFTVIDAVAAPGSLQFRASAGDVGVDMGGTLPSTAGDVTFTVRADVPPDASTLLLRNGEVIAWRAGGAIEHHAAEPGSYRVEVMVPGSPGSPAVPWLLSNPIFRYAPSARIPSSPAAQGAVSLGGVWRTEVSPGSVASVNDGTATRFTYRLAGGEAASQFVALVQDLRDVPEFSTVVLRVRAARPMRPSAQLRYAGDGGRRWKRSFYADQTEREVRIPVAQLRPADGPGTQPPSSRATSLLLVVDLTNAAPGTEGRLDFTDVRLTR
jgi:hypothetical protein